MAGIVDEGLLGVDIVEFGLVRSTGVGGCQYNSLKRVVVGMLEITISQQAKVRFRQSAKTYK
jgi:hypothetical protein